MLYVYVVYRNQDTTEGRGPMIFQGAFIKEETAIAYAKSLEPYSSKYYPQFCKVEKTEVFKGSPEEITKVEERKKVNKALSKLTKEEQELLGLSNNKTSVSI